MKVLLLQTKKIGDVLLTTPAIRALKNTHPDWELHYLTSPPCDQILQNSPYISKIWRLRRKAGLKETISIIKNIRREKFDVLVDLLSAPRTAVISFFSGIPKRIGFNSPHLRHLAYHIKLDLPDRKNDNIYAAALKIKLLSSLGVKGGSLDADFQGQRARKPRKISASQDINISVSTVSESVNKRWPKDNFINLIDTILNKANARIFLIGSAEEKNYIENIYDSIYNKKLVSVHTFSDLTSFWEFADTIDYHIGNDNGQRHLLIARGVPTFGIFGSEIASAWTPPNSDIHATIENKVACKFSHSSIYPSYQIECLNIKWLDATNAALREIAKHFPEHMKK
ncbi:MAG: glycosyltransferase family 9 protein [SAR324 cluster bacterium]|nr:glycosyltransferase family 9 protein [SAR324 cluster bacterium]